MSRVKLIILLIILSLVGILLGQNRQLLGLKFFCPDIASQDCFYRTPDLPLAAWMAIFIMAGILSSLVWQLLSQLANRNISDRKNREPSRDRKQKTRSSEPKAEASTRKSRFQKTPTKSPVRDFPLSDWEEEASKDWESPESIKSDRKEIKRERSQQSPKSQSQAPKDSVYSYNFSKTTEPKNPEPQDSKGSRDNTKDDVYDATYRTVNNSNNSPKTSSDSSDSSDEDEQWI